MDEDKSGLKVEDGEEKRRRIETIWRYRKRTLTGQMTMKKRKGPRRPRKKLPRTLDFSKEYCTVTTFFP